MNTDPDITVAGSAAIPSIVTAHDALDDANSMIDIVSMAANALTHSERDAIQIVIFSAQRRLDVVKDYLEASK